MKNNKLIISLLISYFLFPVSCTKQEMLVATGEVKNILPTTVEITGLILSAGDGIKKYGHCYAKTPNPTISDSKTEFTVTIGIGEFTSYLQDLEPGTKYYAKAYLTRDNIIVYGNEINFTTGTGTVLSPVTLPD
jgi:hypothetical protein